MANINDRDMYDALVAVAVDTTARRVVTKATEAVDTAMQTIDDMTARPSVQTGMQYLLYLSLRQALVRLERALGNGWTV